MKTTNKIIATSMLAIASASCSAASWFPVALHNGEVAVLSKSGLSAEACVKIQINAERKLKGAKVHCFRMTQKVLHESPDASLDREYRVRVASSFVRFTETPMKRCNKEKDLLKKYADAEDQFYCAASYQLIK